MSYQNSRTPKTVTRRSPESRVGEKYARWTILEIVRGNRNGIMTKARCECGTEAVRQLGNIVRGLSLSCGCYLRSQGGLDANTLYRAWAGMKARCNNPNRDHADRYLLRGITVCHGWTCSFEAFESQMHSTYRHGLSLDRIDNEKGYWCGECAECRQHGRTLNCMWADNFQQGANKSNSRFLEVKGERLTASQWGRRVGISPRIITKRIDRDGWTAERAVSTPCRKVSKPNRHQ